MRTTVTEFKTNLDQFLDLVSQTDIYITRNGKVIATLTKPGHDNAALLDSLVGSLPDDSAADETSIKEDRLSKQ
ncbi:type II toxin-antitoxin system Phd/YefM family antitoxin [Galactobacillus timonensis]|uniref:type II toxin-antitoxin system Phd/YefM family antitoxin n=1 Tax=Galactobacillus timonensis TaxID=2041840 RepID=UPI0023F06FC7|nr:type II toxin-antitoxin system Phd/YefM family antitoxin [Galactobacillus timonensis]MCI6754885.1 type II toxin-antitoxin system Phd/YefM family antitoxin [Galactobacillus timonensis]